MEEQKVCPVAKKCGGCSWQGISYEEQLKKKQKQIRKLLKNICPVEPIIGMKNPYHYRNKSMQRLHTDEMAVLFPESMKKEHIVLFRLMNV